MDEPDLGGPRQLDEAIPDEGEALPEVLVLEVVLPENRARPDLHTPHARRTKATRALEELAVIVDKALGEGPEVVGVDVDDLVVGVRVRARARGPQRPQQERHERENHQPGHPGEGSTENALRGARHHSDLPLSVNRDSFSPGPLGIPTRSESASVRPVALGPARPRRAETVTAPRRCGRPRRVGRQGSSTVMVSPLTTTRWPPAAPSRG